jgi:hypothetical protein
VYEVPVRRMTIVRTVLAHRRLAPQSAPPDSWPNCPLLCILTTKIRFENITPRILSGSKSGGMFLFLGKVSCQGGMAITVSATKPRPVPGTP